jgi:uncharacterized protein YbaR (Trm112 family)
MINNDQLSDRKRDSGGATLDHVPAALEPWVVSLLACPVDRSGVKPDGSELVCTQCGRRYPVQNGIPNMLPELTKSEH